MSRPAVSIRVRGRDETTLEVQFDDAETVADFKTRVFGDVIGEGKRCRLIASGKELQDSQKMGSYRIQEGSCMHVMISQRGSVAGAAQGSPGAAAVPQAAGSTSSSRGVGRGAGSAILCALTLGMVMAAWTVYMVFPELFSCGATCLLLLLTLLQLAATLPILKQALLAALGTCWWRPSVTRRPSSVPGRRRQ
ncbi:unnamed protein product [Ectocarpus sp. CCAP 1310/34]|nr:unnamed protein product [Ectocarpus sp. CCAP 1310/34]